MNTESPITSQIQIKIHQHQCCRQQTGDPYTIVAYYCWNFRQWQIFWLRVPSPSKGGKSWPDRDDIYQAKTENLETSLFLKDVLIFPWKVIGIYLFRGGAINTFGLNINLCFWRIFFFVRKPYNTNNEDHRNNRNTDGRRNDESRKTDRNENGNCRGPRTQTRTPYTDNRETDQTDLSDHDDRVLAVINCRDEPKYVNYGTAVCRENETNRENNVQSRNS